MGKLKNRQDVIEWYWPNFLEFCMKSTSNIANQDRRADKSDYGYPGVVYRTNPTVDNFWLWYITDGPMGVKNAGRHYSKETVEYV